MTDGATTSDTVLRISSGLLSMCHKSASSSMAVAVQAALNARKIAGMTTLQPTALR